MADIQDRITELMSHHKEDLARKVAESEPSEAVQIIAALRTQNAGLLAEIGAVQVQLAGLQAEVAAHSEQTEQLEQPMVDSTLSSAEHTAANIAAAQSIENAAVEGADAQEPQG